MRKVIFAIIIVSINWAFASDQSKLANAIQKDKTIQMESKSALFPYSNEFIDAAQFPVLKSEVVEKCTVSFKKKCAEEDFPGLKNYTLCLNAEREKFRADKDCYPLLKSLVHANVLGYFAQTTKSCKSYYEFCVEEQKKGGSLTLCMLKNQKLPPLCRKLAEDSFIYRQKLSEIYSRKMTNLKK
jgi:hypothetical protein